MGPFQLREGTSVVHPRSERRNRGRHLRAGGGCSESDAAGERE